MKPCEQGDVRFETLDTRSEAMCKKRQLRINQRVLLYPSNNVSLSQRVRMLKNDHMLHSFTASLGLPARGWAHLDMSA